MRLSRFLAPTLREAPAEATTVAATLLLRSGAVRQVEAGRHAWLPLGVRTLSRLRKHVEIDMELRGIQPIRPAARTCVSEAIEEIAAFTLLSWRVLPQRWSCVAWGPPGPLLPGRTFLDDAACTATAWSFDRGASSDASFKTLIEVVHAALQGLRLAPRWVVAPGGKVCIVDAEVGDTPMMRCRSCSWEGLPAATHVKKPVRPACPPDLPMPEAFPTPGVRTILELAAPPYDVRPDRQLKTMVMDADGELVIAVVPGDRELDEEKLAFLLGARRLAAAGADAIRAFMGASPGSLGGVGTQGKRLYVDASLAGAWDRVTGANRDDHHLRNVSVDRDLAHGILADLCRVQDTDPCPACGGSLKRAKALVLAQVARCPGVHPSVSGPEGRAEPLQLVRMAFGLDRVLAAVVETHHDADGICWPPLIAPFTVSLLNLKPGDTEMDLATGQLARRLGKVDITVLEDDRDERAGVKFKDADLYGAPFRISIGPRGMAVKAAEVKLRTEQKTEVVSLDDVVDWIRNRLHRA